MRGLLSILSLFHNEFNEINNTKPRMLSLVYMHKLHPGANLLPGAKLHPGVNLLPLMQRSYVNKLFSYVIGFAL